MEIAGRDVTDEIRETRIDAAVSSVSRHQVVRRIMRGRQRELAHAGDAVVEGRDIGTVVCPDAEVKVFLVADTDERARRGGSAASRGRVMTPSRISGCATSAMPARCKAPDAESHRHDGARAGEVVDAAHRDGLREVP